MSTMQEALLRWLDHLTIQGHSTHTVMGYHHDVVQFFSYCTQQKIDMTQLKLADLRGYMTYCVEHHGWGNATIQRTLSAIRNFMQWYSQEHSTTSSLKDFQIKRTARPLPGILSPKVVAQLLDQTVPDGALAQWLWIRDKAMFELIYSSGLRLSELTGLRINDLDSKQALVRIEHGKGNKTRLVPVGQQALHAAQQWIAKRGQRDHAFLFINQHGQPITTRQIQNRLKYQAKRAGLSADVYPHLLRHCFATHLLSTSGELRAVQEMLGHSSLNSTQVYTHLDFERLASVYRDAHPRAKHES